MKNISAGDSIRINSEISAKVSDNVGNGNKQDNPANIRRLIGMHQELIKKHKPYDLVLKATILDMEKEVAIPDDIHNIPEVKQVLQNCNKVNGRYKGIMVVFVEPVNKKSPIAGDKCKAAISLYDPLGNALFTNKEMGYYQKQGVFNKMVFVWNGENTLGRIAGPGSYYIRVKAQLFYEGNPNGPLKVLHRLVGVKKY